MALIELTSTHTSTVTHKHTQVNAHIYTQLQASFQAKLCSLTGSPLNLLPAFFFFPKENHVSIANEGGLSPRGDPTHSLTPEGPNMVPLPLKRNQSCQPHAPKQWCFIEHCLPNIRGSRIEIQFKELWCLQTVFPQRWKKTGMLFLELGQKKLILVVIQEKRKKSMYMFTYELGGWTGGMLKCELKPEWQRHLFDSVEEPWGLKSYLDLYLTKKIQFPSFWFWEAKEI